MSFKIKLCSGNTTPFCDNVIPCFNFQSSGDTVTINQSGGTVNFEVVPTSVWDCTELSGCPLFNLSTTGDTQTINGGDEIVFQSSGTTINITQDGNIINLEALFEFGLMLEDCKFTCEDLEGCSIDQLGDVGITNASNGDVFLFSGGTWINASLCVDSFIAMIPPTDSIECSDVTIGIIDEIGNTESLIGCGDPLPLSRDMRYQISATNGALSGITTSFADAVPNGQSLAAITTYDNVTAIATTNATNSGENSIVSGSGNENLGNHSFITGLGNDNKYHTTIGTGIFNDVNSVSSLFYGRSNTINSANADVTGNNVIGGQNNTATDINRTMIGGTNSTYTNVNWSLMHGNANNVSGTVASIGTGTSNVHTGFSHTIFGGVSNTGNQFQQSLFMWNKWNRCII